MLVQFYLPVVEIQTDLSSFHFLLWNWSATPIIKKFFKLHILSDIMITDLDTMVALNAALLFYTNVHNIFI